MGRANLLANLLIVSVLALFVGAIAAPHPAMADNKANWDKLSTALVFGLVGGAELKTLSRDDQPGQIEFLKTMVTTLAVSEGLKAVVHEKRPDGSGNDSFPSGHAALAFAAASYFDLRYGAQNKALVPVVYGVAALSAIGRVEARKHVFKDVAAGAFIGIALAHVFTTREAEVSVYPTGDGAGINYTRRF